MRLSRIETSRPSDNLTIECWSASCQVDNVGNRGEVYLQPFRVGLEGAWALVTAPVLQVQHAARCVKIGFTHDFYTVQALGFIETEALDCLNEGLEGDDFAAQARRFQPLLRMLA